MNRYFFISLLVLSSFSLISCKQLKQVEEMHDTTVSMSKNTEHMASTTASMSQTTQNMEDLTKDLRDLSGWMFNVLKQGDTSRLRDEAIKDMVASESFMRKSLMATKYFYGFEYQIWNTPRFRAQVDNLVIRENLKAEAVIEYAKTLAEFIPSDRKETGTSSDEQMKNLYALVAAMHKVNDYQQDMIKGSDTPRQVSILSMFTILDEGLSILPKLENGEVTHDELTRSQIEVLRERPIFEYALKVRYMFLPVFALARISNIAEASFFEKAKMMLTKWEPNFLSPNKMNLEEIYYASEILRKTKDTKELLIKCGIEIKLDKKIVKIFAKMERGLVSTDNLRGEDLTRAKIYNQNLSDFYQLLDDVLK